MKEQQIESSKVDNIVANTVEEEELDNEYNTLLSGHLMSPLFQEYEQHIQKQNT